MNSEQQPLWQRLEGFINQIRARHAEIMLEAEAGCRDIIAGDPTETIPLGNAIHALDRRFDQLLTKLDDTWSDKIQDMFIDANTDKDKPIPFDDQGMELKERAHMDLENAWVRLKVKLQADQYRTLWPLAQQEMSKPVSCTNCGMQLQPATVHKSCNVTCPGCNSVNQCIPHKAVAGYYGGGAHAFGEEASVEQRLAIEQWRWEVDRDRRYKDWPQEPVESLDHWLQMETQYWTMYAQMKAQITGETAEEMNTFIKSRVDQFIESSLKTESHWRRAKGL